MARALIPHLTRTVFAPALTALRTTDLVPLERLSPISTRPSFVVKTSGGHQHSQAFGMTKHGAVVGFLDLFLANHGNAQTSWRLCMSSRKKVCKTRTESRSSWFAHVEHAFHHQDLTWSKHLLHGYSSISLWSSNVIRFASS